MKKRILICCMAVSMLLTGCSPGELFGMLLVFRTDDGPDPSVIAEKVKGEDAGPSAGKEEWEPEAEEEPVDLHSYDFTVAFAGDVNLADNWNTMDYYRQQENGIYDCIDPALIGMMREADLMCLNMEYSMSSVGAPMNGKMYTFRADPSSVEILKELGTDLVNLANNHVYDYGEDAFLDMLDILDREDIPYVGAGRNAEEAETVYYTELDGKTVAVVAATRAEKYKLTPEATEDSPGVFRCYDRERLLEVTREADENADFVIAYIHWGTEYSEELEEAQTEGARALAEAGADVVLGAHPHCLQGAEYVGNVPVLYSLGNYWFNEKPLDSVLVKLHFYGDDEGNYLDTILVPARQENHYTRLLTDPEQVEAWNAHMIRMSPGNIWIDEKGRLRNGDQESDGAGASPDEENLSGGISEKGA